MRTSLTHPLRIDRIRPPNCAGEIGMTICPGKCDPYPISGGGAWDRRLDADLDTIREQEATTLVTLLENHEFRLLRVEDLEAETRKRGMEWVHLPIRDGDAPGKTFERLWIEAGEALHRELSRGALIVLHCRGGLGRTGTVAARLLMERGVTVEEAIQQVRKARLGAIETADQENYLRNLSSRPEFADAVKKRATLA
ncbi:cyclin-dependent kinase inhibitor 3 family protein [Rhodoblastus sp.]|uniref:cyclin-dependent kinase inhibitor 3 family protein n=1 Tax=Rhodoblastus sp. TaxID=1962975 RepID=UPI003F99EA17